MQGFDSCISLSQVTFGKQATLWHGVFKGCSNLTQVMLGGGAKLHDHAFIECNALQLIIVNTCSDAEVERVRNSLLPEYRDKVVKNPMWGSVSSLQASYSYQDAFLALTLNRPQESVILWKKLECFNLVQRYYAFLLKLIDTKQQKYPAFFSGNGQVFVDVKTKLYVINKLMEWLKGDDEVCFTQDKVNLLNGETLIIRKLVELSIELPDEASSNAMVLG